MKTARLIFTVLALLVLTVSVIQIPAQAQGANSISTRPSTATTDRG